MSTYKATLRYIATETPALQVFDKTPELNVVTSVSDNQIVFTHSCIKEATTEHPGSIGMATLCEIYDLETTAALQCVDGQASLQVIGVGLNNSRVEATDYKVCITIEF